MHSDALILSTTWFYWLISMAVLYICALLYGHRSGCFWAMLLHGGAVTLLLISEYAIDAPGLEFLAERPFRPGAFRPIDAVAYTVLWCWLVKKYWRRMDG
jgi:hypothetical protein